MKRNYQTFVEDLSDKVKKNPKRFWSFFMKRQNQKLYQILLLMVFQNTVIQLLKLIYLTNIFNLFFIRIFLLPTSTLKTREPKANLSSVEFDHLQIKKILSGLDANKASGPDNLSSRILKECATVLAPSLTLLFEMRFASGHIPVQWKQGHVVPVHKKDKSQVSNYRPISLLCIVSKVMERYIYNIVFKVVRPIINTNQHGFMNGKSCTTQLLTIYDEIGKHLDEGKQTDMIFLDFSKAFDSNYTDCSTCSCFISFYAFQRVCLLIFY